MTREHSYDCEPLRVWNRLEPRARQVDFDRVLQAEIRDPLWMLGRQWQFGEFKGEDTGSAILAKLALRHNPPRMGEWAAARRNRMFGERVLLRWLRAQHDAGGDAQIAALLLDASLAALEPLDATPVVRQASHSLTGHDCGHDHSHDHGHTHAPGDGHTHAPGDGHTHDHE